MEVPAQPGDVSISGNLLINRMNRTQVSIWHIGPGDPPPASDDVCLTDTTDSHCWLAVIGDSTPSVLEHVTNLDLFPPAEPSPFLTQGPILHVPCQIITWARDCVLIALSRGYGQRFVDAMFRSSSGAGSVLRSEGRGGAARPGLLPGGERIFTEWLADNRRGGQ